MADWAQLSDAVTSARAAAVNRGLVAAHDQLAAKLRDEFDQLGVCLADDEALYVALVSVSVLSAYQESTGFAPFRVAAHVYGALASMVPEQVLA